MDEQNQEQSQTVQPTEFTSAPAEQGSQGLTSPEFPKASLGQQDASDPRFTTAGEDRSRGGYDPRAGYGSVGYPGAGYGPAGYMPEKTEPSPYGTDAYPPGGYSPGFPPGGYPPGGYAVPANEPVRAKHSRRGRKWVATSVAMLMVIGAGAGAGIAYASRQTRTSSVGLTASATGHKLTTAQIAAKVDPAVVDVETNLGEGTGMVVTSTGEIITNNHVIEDASTIKVVIDHRGTYKATVVGTDATADVAVLKLSGVSGLKTVKFASSSTVKIGDTVVAIGNAGGQGFPSTVTAGAVTALDRTITAVDEVGATERLKDMIQTDAVLVAGNSGGPLVDSSGGVIGMDTAAGRTEGGSSTGYALPVNQVLKIANEMEAGKSGNGIVVGSQAFLGIAGETVSSSSGSTVSGIGIEYVESGSSAALAGIEMGDVIVAFDGHVTATIGELSTLVHKLRPGDRATVTFENSSGSTETVTVTLTTAPPA